MEWFESLRFTKWPPSGGTRIFDGRKPEAHIDLAYALFTPVDRMNTSRRLRLVVAFALVSASASFSFAGTAEDVARAAAIVQRMMELNHKFAAYNVALEAPAALDGAKGKYFLPINANGALTGWAEKALVAQVGNIAGEQAGAAAGKGLASVLPGGGLASGFLKKKGKESGAMLALGGTEFVKKNTALSFDSIEAYAVYLHARAGQGADYSRAVQAAIALYPDLEKTYASSIQAAFDAAMKVATATKAAKEAEAAKLAAEAAAKATPTGATTTTTVTTPTVTTTPAPAATATAPALATP